MKIKSVMLLAIAMGCGLVAMLGVQQVLSGNRAPVVVEPELAGVYIASQEIPAGTLLDETMVKIEKRAKSAVPAGAVTDPKEFQDRSLIVKLFPGDLILDAKLGEKGRSGASITIPKGMRAVTVPVTSTQTHSGMMQPGDRVDVLATYAMQNTKQKTKTVLENIQIFAIDNQRNVETASVDSSKVNSKTVSLVVTPDQANLLMLASTMGTLQLALRNVDDTAPGNAQSVDGSSLDGAGISQGMVAENEPVVNTRAKSATPSPKKGLKDFLNDTSSRDTDEEAPAPPEKKTWSITIYEKNTKRVEEIELPAEPDKAASAETVPVEHNHEGVTEAAKSSA